MSHRPVLMAAVMGFWALATPLAAETRLEAEGTRIHGERETAHALAVVPWRDRRGALPPGLGVEGLLQDPLRPLDREVFENRLKLHRQRRAVEGRDIP